MHLPIQTYYQETSYNIKVIILLNSYYYLTQNNYALLQVTFNVSQQNQFATSSLTTTYDSINKIWSISGTVKDVSKSQLNNIQVTALFYDGNGNLISNNPLIYNVFPNILHPFEDGLFSLNVSVNNDLKGVNPLYIVLIYSQQQNLNANSGPSPELQPTTEPKCQ